MKVSTKQGRAAVGVIKLLAMVLFVIFDTAPANLVYLLQMFGVMSLSAVATAVVLAFISE